MAPPTPEKLLELAREETRIAKESFRKHLMSALVSPPSALPYSGSVGRPGPRSSAPEVDYEDAYSDRERGRRYGEAWFPSFRRFQSWVATRQGVYCRVGQRCYSSGDGGRKDNFRASLCDRKSSPQQEIWLPRGIFWRTSHDLVYDFKALRKLRHPGEDNALQ